MTESEIQRSVFDHIRKRGAPGVVAWAVPNNPMARRTVGYREGVSDISIVHGGQFFALELKREKGTATEAQRRFISEVQRAGGEAVIAEGCDEAIRVLELWGVIKPEAA